MEGKMEEFWVQKSVVEVVNLILSFGKIKDFLDAKAMISGSHFGS